MVCFEVFIKSQVLTYQFYSWFASGLLFILFQRGTKLFSILRFFALKFKNAIILVLVGIFPLSKNFEGYILLETELERGETWNLPPPHLLSTPIQLR